MIRPLLSALLFLIASAAPARAQLVVVAGPEPGAARAEGLLQLAGFAYQRLAPAEVTSEALAGARTVVLLRAPLMPAGVAALEQFAAAGGKLVLIGQEGAPELYRAVGVEATPAAPPERFERIVRAPDEGLPPGLPGLVRDAVTPSIVLTPLPETRVLARRATAMSGPNHPGAGGASPPSPPPTANGPAAVTVAAGGAAISGLFAPGDQWEKSWLLQAVLAAVDPALAEPASRGLRRQAAEALTNAAAHWSRVRDRAALSRGEREQRLRTLQALRAEGSSLQRAPLGERPMANAAALQGYIQRVRALDLRLTPSMAGEIRGVWIHTYTPTDWDRVARRVKAAGLNCLFARVGRGGNLIYPSALLPRDAWAEKAGGDELQRAIEAAHRHGLQFHAWRVNFHMGSAPKEYRDRMAAEDRLVRDSKGAQANFANPGDPRNTELEFQVIRELVEKYDIDGFQFDYIRYPDDPGYDYDYGPVSRREFERKLGRPVPNWPEDVRSGSFKTAYEDWERENVNRLVERVYREVKRLKPRVQVSAAVWRNHRRYWAIIKQDWPLWVERGWLDFVVPMDYTPEMETFAATVDAQVSLTRGKMPLAAGIGNWLLQTPEELVRQVEIAREAGAAGFVLFAYNAEQIEEQLAGLRAGATAQGTWPAYQAPPVRITLAPPAVAPKDAPLAVTAGSPLKVQVTEGGYQKAEATRRHGGTETAEKAHLEKPRETGVGSPSGRDARAPREGGQVRLERPNGEPIQVLGRMAADGPTVLSGAAPAGRFQAVVRGTTRVDGKEQPFVVRGPLAEGLSAVEVQALRAEERPPVFPIGGAGPRVGVYAGGLGAETLVAALAAQEGLRVAAVHRLRPEHLAVVETLVLPQLADVAELGAAVQKRLRQWVEGGGTLILTHDSVGARWHPRLFPELVRDVELAPATPLVTVEALDRIAKGTRIAHTGGDQFRIAPGLGARILLRESRGLAGPETPGAPVVVGGAVGKGTVVLVGFLSGYQQLEVAAEEARLLAALARYRTGAVGARLLGSETAPDR